jgi:hypothetical protein
MFEVVFTYELLFILFYFYVVITIVIVIIINKVLVITVFWCIGGCQRRKEWDKL